MRTGRTPKTANGSQQGPVGGCDANHGPNGMPRPAFLMTDGRARVCDWLRGCLIGPRGGTPHESLAGIKPLDRYHTGILFPVLADAHGIDADIEDADDAVEPELGDARSDASNPSQPRRRFVPPSAVGFSFYVEGSAIELQVIPRAVRYEPADDGTKAGRADHWQPATLGGDADAKIFTMPSVRRREQERSPVFEGRAEIMVLWRPLAEGWLVTVSLSNTQHDPGKGDDPRRAAERNARALLQVALECIPDAGQVGDYPRVDASLLDDEEQDLELQYRSHRIYAIGHGAAVDWEVTDGQVRNIRSEFLPLVEVPQVSADGGPADAQVLGIDWLADIESDPTARFDALSGFAERYADWVEREELTNTGLPTADAQVTGRRVVARMHEALRRIREGIELLRNDLPARQAFGLANRAMAAQMRQAMAIAGTPAREPAWRPFQLAFVLLALPSALDADHDDRETVDLIWFPTGGGKTEAYLGLLACVICWRRIKYPTSGGGTAALMRYTLRLLTKDQFRRAARLVCALDRLRRERPELGTEPITLGLWVGGDSSPNSFKAAMEVLAGALGAGEDEGNIPLPGALVLEQCPWCGARLWLPDNVDAGPGHLHFRCTDPDCAFGASADASLPCNVVDTALYEQPPTLLLATVDKFARLAWEERAGAFLGGPGRRPPELIIQDELHLIASALGSIAGLYEAAVETVLSVRDLPPKIIASTATIRQARDQVRRLFGREPAVFPPPGLECNDSYFARTVPTSKRPGRLYIGYLAPAQDRQHSLAPLAAALLSAPDLLFGDAPAADREALLDAWWTVLVYHGSLRGVGISRNALQDIETGMERLLREHQAEQGRGHDAASDPTPDLRTGPHTGLRPWLAERITQLTSHMSADENARAFARLQLPRDDRRGPRPRASHQHGLGRARRRPTRGDGHQRPATDHGGVHPGQQPGRTCRRAGHRGRQLLPRSGPQPVSLRELPRLPRILLPFRRAHQRHAVYLPGPAACAACGPGHRRASRLPGPGRERPGRRLRSEPAGDRPADRGARAALPEGRPQPGRRDCPAPARVGTNNGRITPTPPAPSVSAWSTRGSDGDRRDLRLLYTHDDKVPGLWARCTACATSRTPPW